MPAKENLNDTNRATREARSSDASNKISCIRMLKELGITVAFSFVSMTVGIILGYTGVTITRIINDGPPEEDEEDTEDSNSTAISDTSDNIPPGSPFSLSTEEAALYTSILFAGCVLGSLICNPLIHKFGQVKTILFVLPLTLLGWLILYFTVDFWLQIFARTVMGIYMTIAYPSSGSYLTESFHSKLRHLFVGVNILARQLGLLFVFGIGSTELHWKLVGLICGVVPLVVPFISLFFVPNSPKWLASVGREEEAKDSMKFFRGKKCDVDKLYKEMDEEAKRIEESSGICSQCTAICANPNSRIFLLMAYITVAINLTGDSAVLSYAVMIFESGTSEISPYTSSVIYAFVRVLGTFICTIISDRFGRRPILLAFLPMTCFATALAGGYFYMKFNNYAIEDYYWMPTAALSLYGFSNCFSFSMFEIMKAKVLPIAIRRVWGNVLDFIAFCSLFFIVLSYPLVAKGVGPHWAFWLYSVNTFMMVIIVYFFLPETKGKTSEEIAAHF